MGTWLDKDAIKKLQETASTKHNDLIDLLILAVQRRFISESNYDPETGTRTEYIEVLECNEIALHYYPVTSITSIEEVSGSFTAEISSSDYTVYKDGVIKFAFKITGTLKIVYIAGYSIAEMPANIPDILHAIKEQVVDSLNKDLHRLGKKSQGKAGETITFNDIPLTEEFKSICELYSNPIPDRTIVS